MKLARIVFYILVLLGSAGSFVLLRIPANKYEWMRTDTAVGSASAPLPVDSDAKLSLAVFALPVGIAAVACLAIGLIWLRGRLRTTAVAFSLLLLAVILWKFAFA